MNTEIKRPEGGLLQTAAWADFQRAWGTAVRVWRNEAGAVHGMVVNLPAVGAYLYIPRGCSDVLLSALLPTILRDARRAGYRWVRIEPQTEEGVAACRSVAPNVCRAAHPVQAPCVLQMSLDGTEEDLLQHMKPKTRYNIRLAEKKGVIVRSYTPSCDPHAASAVDSACTLLAATAQRKGVRFHDASYFRTMLVTLPAEQCNLVLACYEGKPLAANIMTYANGVATYLHGGTDGAHRNVMAPFAAQWHAMRDARARGCTIYDFGGAAPETARGNTLASVIRFKRGFEPDAPLVCTPGAWDIPLWRGYALYRHLHKMRSSALRLIKTIHP